MCFRSIYVSLAKSLPEYRTYGVGTQNLLAVHFKDQSEHTVGSGMLRPKVDGKIPEVLLVHGQTFGPAFSSPGRIG